MGHPGGQLADRGHLFLLDDAGLGVLQLAFHQLFFLEQRPFSQSSFHADRYRCKCFGGLDNIVKRAGLDRIDGHLFITVTGHHDHRKGGLANGRSQKIKRTAIGEIQIHYGNGRFFNRDAFAILMQACHYLDSGIGITQLKSAP